jgi:hypothetical protein
MLQYRRQPVLKQTWRRTAPNCSLGPPGSPSTSAALPMRCSSDATGALTTTLPDTALQSNMATMMHWQAPRRPLHSVAVMKDTAMSTPQHGQRNSPSKCRAPGMEKESAVQYQHKRHTEPQVLFGAPSCTPEPPRPPSTSAALPMCCSSDATGALTATLPDIASQHGNTDDHASASTFPPIEVGHCDEGGGDEETCRATKMGPLRSI